MSEQPKLCPDCKRERGPGNEGKCGALLHPVWCDECILRSYKLALKRLAASSEVIAAADRLRAVTECIGGNDASGKRLSSAEQDYDDARCKLGEDAT